MATRAVLPFARTKGLPRSSSLSLGSLRPKKSWTSVVAAAWFELKNPYKSQRLQHSGSVARTPSSYTPQGTRTTDRAGKASL
jgi:hypothetical protein